MTKPYTKDIEQDELILAAIIAGGMASGRRVAPALRDFYNGQAGHDNGWGVEPGQSRRGPCCAVGAGVLFAGLDTVADARDAFSSIHKVSREYAYAVSNGFECHEQSLPYWTKPDGDRARGDSVGSAAYDFFHGED